MRTAKQESLVRKTRQKLLKFLFTSKLSARDAHEVLGSLADALGAQDEEQLVAQELRQEQGAQQEQEEQERASLIKTAADLPGTPQSPSPRSQGEPGPAWAAGREPLASGSGVPPAATAAARARSSFVRGAETTEMQHITEELLVRSRSALPWCRVSRRVIGHERVTSAAWLALCLLTQWDVLTAHCACGVNPMKVCACVRVQRVESKHTEK